MKRLIIGFFLSLALWQPFILGESGQFDRFKTVRESLTEFRNQLGIPEGVKVLIEGDHPRLVSLRRSHEDENLFLLTFDRMFFESLDEAELRAAVAHEVGHLWIFTHHPYLQTEKLANRFAKELVAREDLERVYQKMSEKLGTRWDLTSMLGQK